MPSFAFSSSLLIGDPKSALIGLTRNPLLGRAAFSGSSAAGSGGSVGPFSVGGNDCFGGEFSLWLDSEAKKKCKKKNHILKFRKGSDQVPYG